MDQDRIWLLIARKLSNEATPEELHELNEMFKAHPDIQYAYTLMNELGESTGDACGADEAAIGRMQRDGLAQIEALQAPVYPWEQRSAKWLSTGRIAVVAILFLLVTGGILFILKPHPQKQLAATEKPQQTPGVYVASKTSSIVLQDGTKVWLNQGSVLRCSDDFGLHDREVTLEGEAFFDVTSNPEKPFIVHAGSWMDIKVLGTQFNVKAYPGNPYIETALITGKVAVNINNADKKQVILQPHQKLTFYMEEKTPGSDKNILADKTNPVQIVPLKMNTADQTIAETAWIDNKLAFNDVPFGELAYDLERMYHKKITFRDTRIKSYHLTGEFKGETIDEVLRALQITTPFTYTISDSLIIINR